MLPVSQLTSAANFLPAPAADVVRVVIAGDNPLARAGLAAVIGGFDDIVVLGDVSSIEKPDARLRLLAPDVIVVADAQHAGAAVNVDAPTLLLVRSDSLTSASIRNSGARGVISRDSSPARIRAAIRAVSQGLLVFDDETFGDDSSPSAEPVPLAEPLTAREGEVLELLAAGLTNKEIGSRLGITDHTVKFHVNAILGKLGAETRTEAVVQAARRGIVAL